MIDLGCLKFYLGIQKISLDRGIFMCQRLHANILEQFCMNDYNPTQTPLPKGFKIGKKKKHLNQLFPLSFIK